MSFELSTEDWPEGISPEEDFYVIGETYEWEIGGDEPFAFGEHLPVREGEVAFFTRCIGFVQVGDLTVAVIRKLSTYFTDDEDHVERFALDPVFDRRTGGNIPRGEEVIPIAITRGESLPVLSIQDSSSDLFSQYEWDQVLEDIRPQLIDELVNGEPMCEFVYDEVAQEVDDQS